MTHKTSSTVVDWGTPHAPRLEGRAGARPHSTLSNKRQLMRLCARIGFNPPSIALHF